MKLPLSKTHSNLATQWHPAKNEDLTPDDVTYGSKRKIWWRCDKIESHEWLASINNRTISESGCPYCSGNKVDEINCLSTSFPEIAAQWHPTKNGVLTPRDVTKSSGVKVWWSCPVGEDHEWIARITTRTIVKSNCPCCSRHKTVLSNCLSATHPELAKEWHPTKNGKLNTYEITQGYHKKVWWKCEKEPDHEWEASPSSRTNIWKTDCPCCAGLKVVLSNCLTTTCPEIAAQWHPTKNGVLTPRDVPKGSNKKVWWKCEKEHEWCARIAARTQKQHRGCPVCKQSKGEKAISNFLVKNNIKFKPQHSFDECRNIKTLFFDFIIWQNQKIMLIEYQGRQHYEIANFSKNKEQAEKEFILIQQRDGIKKNWAKNNSIPLLEIPYWKFDEIEILINNFIEGVI